MSKTDGIMTLFLVVYGQSKSVTEFPDIKKKLSQALGTLKLDWGHTQVKASLTLLTLFSSTGSLQSPKLVLAQG